MKSIQKDKNAHIHNWQALQCICCEFGSGWFSSTTVPDKEIFTETFHDPYKYFSLKTNLSGTSGR